MCADSAPPGSLPGLRLLGPRPTVLVIDDDQAVVEIVAIALRLAGMGVVGAADAREGVQLASSEEWDVALLDVDMPGISGWAALDSLKAHYHRPVVMMSGLATPAEATDRGADGFLAKPFSITELVETIRRCAAPG